MNNSSKINNLRLLAITTAAIATVGASPIVNAAEVNLIQGQGQHQGQGAGNDVQVQPSQQPAPHPEAAPQPEPVPQPEVPVVHPDPTPAPVPVHQPEHQPNEGGNGNGGYSPQPEHNPEPEHPTPSPEPEPVPGPSPAPMPAPAPVTNNVVAPVQQSNLNAQQQTEQQTQVGVALDQKTELNNQNNIGIDAKGGAAQSDATGGKSVLNSAIDNKSTAQGNKTNTVVDASNRSVYKYYNPGASNAPNITNVAVQSGLVYNANVLLPNGNVMSIGNLNIGAGQVTDSTYVGVNTIFGGFGYSGNKSKPQVAAELRRVAQMAPTYIATTTAIAANPFMCGASANTMSQLLYTASMESDTPTQRDIAILTSMGQIQYAGSCNAPTVPTPPHNHGGGSDGGTTGIEGGGDAGEVPNKG